MVRGLVPDVPELCILESDSDYFLGVRTETSWTGSSLLGIRIAVKVSKNIVDSYVHSKAHW